MKINFKSFSIVLFVFLAGNISGQNEISFDAMLQDFGYQAADDPPPRKRGGMAQTGGVGAGAIDEAIITDWPSETKVLPENYAIAWETSDDLASFRVTIAENTMLTSNVLFVSVVKGNSMTLPLGDLHMEMDKEYFIQVSGSSINDGHSAKHIITLGNQREYRQSLQECDDYEGFDQKSDIEKQAMESYALESKGYVIDASQYFYTYRTNVYKDSLMRAQHVRFNDRNYIKL